MFLQEPNLKPTDVWHCKLLSFIDKGSQSDTKQGDIT